MRRPVRLHFTETAQRAGTHVNLSAVRTEGRMLWVAGDETATLERLVADDAQRPTAYGEQLTIRLADLVDLPGPPDEEADIEGLARSGDFLWAVGSHSLKRRRVKAGQSHAKALRRLAQVRGEANRQVLLRLPVTEVDGLPRPVREVRQGGRVHRAAAFGARGRDLRDLLADDEHLGPFLPLPGKDNGLDVEGIAVSGERVYLGLRGPVLRGWAFVLELRPSTDPDDPARLRLDPLEDGRPYRKHVLDLGGLGVRDLCPHGDDLLVLAGPSMDLDGPVRVLRWHGAGRGEGPQVVPADRLTRELDLPYGEGDDHAEGIALLPGDDGPELLVVYDSPSPDRRGGDGSVVADAVPLPQRP
jgi:hypothetical protein